MSAFTTLHITRNRAKEFVMNKFFKLSDEQLERFLDDFLEESLYNVRIVGEYAENDDKVLDDYE